MENDVALVLTAVGISPHGIHLHRLAGATSYNFDLDQRLTFPASIIESQQLAPVSERETRTEWPRHSDHDALLDTS